MEKQQKAIKATFSLGHPGGETQTFEGYTFGETWQGYACPMFERSEADRIMVERLQKRFNESTRYGEATDTYSWEPAPRTLGKGGSVTGLDIEFQGKTVHVYPVGAADWAWQQGSQKPQESSKVQKVKGCRQFISGLYLRWLDEKEYEDIEDYGKALARQLGFEVEMTKKPFGFKFDNVHVTVQGDSMRADMVIRER